MITRSRLASWLLAAGLLGLASSARAAEVDKYLPDKTEAVVTVNVHSILHSPLMKRFAGKSLRDAFKDGAAQEMLAAFAFDPLKDVSRVVLASWEEKDKSEWLGIVHGQFDTAKVAAGLKMLAKAQPEGLKVHKEGDHRYYELSCGEPPAGYRGSMQLGLGILGADGAQNWPAHFRMTGSLFVALLDKSTLVVAPAPEAILAAFERSTDGKKPALNRNLRAMIEDVDGHQSLWFAGVASRSGNGAAKRNQSSADDSSITSCVGGLTLKDDVKMEVTLIARNLEAARQTSQAIDDIRTRLQGLVMLLAGNQHERSCLAGIPRAFKDGRKGRVVSLEAQIPAEVFDGLAALLPAPAAPPPPPPPTTVFQGLLPPPPLPGIPPPPQVGGRPSD
jgi:hypothetical protein